VLSAVKEEIAEGTIVMEPLNVDCIQPASIDSHSDNKLLMLKTWRYPFCVDVKQSMDGLSEPVAIGEDKPFFLNAGEFVLASTLESIALPDDIVARLAGKSSSGPIGLLIHSSSGYVDPGWGVHLTLELSDLARLSVTRYHGIETGQLSLLRLTSPAERLYGSPGLGSKYQGRSKAHVTGYHEEFAGRR
jgi:dCTP deaminase